MFPKISPIIPVRRRDLFESTEWVYERKHDGFRLAHLNGSGCRLISRRGNEMKRFIERSIALRHGPPAEIREFREEAAQNRYLIWKLELEIVQLQCFRFGNNVAAYAEAIAVHPTEPKLAPSNPERAQERRAPHRER